MQGGSGDAEDRSVGAAGEAEGGAHREQCRNTHVTRGEADRHWELAVRFRSSNRALRQPGRGEAGSEGVDMYTYSGFMLTCGRNQHNIAKQLSFN